MKKTKVRKVTAGMSKLSVAKKDGVRKSGTKIGAKKSTGIKKKVGLDKKKVVGGPAGRVSTQRRRLSVAAADNQKITNLDGTSAAGAKKQYENENQKSKKQEEKRCFGSFESLSKVGFVPFNNTKVNQDRFATIENFGGDSQKAFFGVFDGHGSVGHDVSSFVAKELPEFFKKSKYWGNDVKLMIDDAFVKCNATLASAKTKVDCTFSGTTVIVVYIDGDTMYSGNAGDSRAVLAKKSPSGKFTAVPLSDDHKPERPDEKKRIIASKGRVEACKGSMGEDIGPARVWLLHQDVPGLAMTRSFGDLIAASVGVIPKPEIWERKMEKDDAFMILASDGVWEFIDSQEAVDIVSKYSPEDACKALVAESTKRWNAEEEVVDDTTCVIVYFDGFKK